MGCFSYLCKVSGKPAWSSSFNGDAVYMFLLKDGKIIEEMHGKYDSYGKVFDNKGDSFEWEMDWGEIVDLHFNGNEKDGIALILACNFDGTLPTTISDDDPDQGWGKSHNGGFRVKEPYHKVYTERVKKTVDDMTTKERELFNALKTMSNAYHTLVGQVAELLQGSENEETYFDEFKDAEDFSKHVLDKYKE